MAKFILPTDYSPNSLNAARYAIQLFGMEGNEFIVLNTYMMPRGAASTMWNMEGMLAKEAQEGMDGFVKTMKQDPMFAQAHITGATEHGDLPLVLDVFAMDEFPPDLVVMGTQGASGLKEVLLGSNTADVIKRGKLPVLAVPEKGSFRVPKRIMLADDGGDLEKADIKALVDIAKSTKAEVMIVRVTDPARPDKDAGPSEYDALLADITHSHHFISGDDVNLALNELATKVDADILVLLHRQRSIFEKIFHRSTTTKLAMHTHIPMLVLQESKG